MDGMPIRTYGGERMPPPTPPTPVQPSEMPDYLPAVERSTGSFRADADNRLWIRPKPLATMPKAAGRSTTSPTERARSSIVFSFPPAARSSVLVRAESSTSRRATAEQRESRRGASSSSDVRCQASF